MKVIQAPNNVIKKQTFDSSKKHKWSKYCIVIKNTQDNYVVHNFMNDSIIFINKSEIQKYKGYLVNNWFLVPFDSDITPYAYDVREVMQKKQVPTFNKVAGYTILTTTDCNAQCYYCYEFGRKKIHMTEKVANDVADFIIKKYNGVRVKLGWFGGEPLYNEKVIDIITKKLKDNNVNYISTMISNGYLFDKDKVEKYQKEWKLNRVQITLDGCEEVYNAVKNYIYEDDENAFERVIDNINTLVNNKIRVSVRLNLSSTNKEELKKLIEFCHNKWKGNKYFSIYAHNIFDEEKSNDEEFLKSIYEDLDEVNNLLAIKGFYKPRMKKMLKNIHCMANSGSSMTINPWGKIGLCEHYSESEYIGSIYEEGYDKEKIVEWNERRDMIDLCEDCVIFPSCYLLKKCPNSYCNAYKKENTIKKLKWVLRNELRKNTQDNSNG